MATTRQIFKSDPKAPKFAKGLYNILHEKGFFKKMKEQYPELKGYSSADISRIICNYNKRLAKEVLTNRNGLKPDSVVPLYTYAPLNCSTH